MGRVHNSWETTSTRPRPATRSSSSGQMQEMVSLAQENHTLTPARTAIATSSSHESHGRLSEIFQSVRDTRWANRSRIRIGGEDLGFARCLPKLCNLLEVLQVVNRVLSDGPVYDEPAQGFAKMPHRNFELKFLCRECPLRCWFKGDSGGERP